MKKWRKRQYTMNTHNKTFFVPKSLSNVHAQYAPFSNNFYQMFNPNFQVNIIFNKHFFLHTPLSLSEMTADVWLSELPVTKL